MELETLKLSTIALFIEQIDRLSNKEIIIRRVILQDHLVLLTFLVELELLGWVYLSVVEGEHLVLELLVDWQVGVEIDWCLLDTLTDDSFLLLLEKIEIGSKPVIFSKFTWSLVQGTLVVLRIIVVIVVLMFVRATWHATN